MERLEVRVHLEGLHDPPPAAGDHVVTGGVVAAQGQRQPVGQVTGEVLRQQRVGCFVTLALQEGVEATAKLIEL